MSGVNILNYYIMDNYGLFLDILNIPPDLAVLRDALQTVLKTQPVRGLGAIGGDSLVPRVMSVDVN